MGHISVTGVRFLCWIYPTDIPSVLWCRWRRTIEGSGRRNARGGALFNAVGSWWDEIPEYFQKRKTSPKGLLQFSIGWLVHIPNNDSNQWWLPELIREWERERERDRDREWIPWTFCPRQRSLTRTSSAPLIRACGGQGEVRWQGGRWRPMALISITWSCAETARAKRQTRKTAAQRGSKRCLAAAAWDHDRLWYHVE